MGLTILPIRRKSIESVKTCEGEQCEADKKTQDRQKQSVLVYPQEYFLMPPSLQAPPIPEKLLQPIR
jgi:hypothetical protein